MLRRNYVLTALLAGASMMATGISVSAAECTTGTVCKEGVYLYVGNLGNCNFSDLLGDKCTNLELPECVKPVLPSIPEVEEESEQTSFAMQVFALVNEERAKAGLFALEYDATIEQAALVRAKETVSSFSHTRPNGSSFSTALTEAGLSYRGAGENIAYGQRTAEEVMEGWMNSAGHRANILNESFTKIGVGYYQHNGVNYWTQLFTY